MVYVGTPPSREPPLILCPSLKRWEPPKRQGLCSYPANSRALSSVGDPPGSRGYLATRALCEPPRTLCPARSIGRSPTGQGLCSHPPTCGPLLILSHSLKCWGPPRRQGLCSHPAHLSVTSDFVLKEPPRAKKTPFGLGDWFTDKDILCWLNHDLCHMEIDEPCTWTLVFPYIKRLSKCMGMMESGTTLDNMACCHRCIFVANGDDKEGSHWFVCAFDCGVRLEHFIVWVWAFLSSIHLFRPFLTAIKKLCLTTKHRALGFQKDGWSCGLQGLHITNVVVHHRGSFSDVPLTPMGPGFPDYVFSIVNADRAVWVIEPPNDDLEGVTELPCPHESPRSTQIEVALSGIEDSVEATPTQLEGKEAFAEQSVEGPEAKAQPSLATPTKEDTSTKKCFSNALRHTLVVLEVLQAHRHFYLSIGPTKSGDNTF